MCVIPPIAHPSSPLDTLLASHSASHSPASSVSPQMPPDTPVSSRPTDHIPLLASRYHQGLSPSHLASHSPASSVLPQMPPIVHRPGLIKVASAESGLSRYPS